MDEHGRGASGTDDGNDEDGGDGVSSHRARAKVGSSMDAISVACLVGWDESWGQQFAAPLSDRS